MAKKEVKNMVNEYMSVIDINFVNQAIGASDKLDDFEMNKSTIMNIANWALNGASDNEIRRNLDLSPLQWKTLVSICPTLLIVMKHSRELADTVIAGSLFQTAIGGKKIKKQVPKTITIYDQETNKPIRQEVVVVDIYEELPPNPILLKFIAENKLSEKFGESKVDNSEHFRKAIDGMTPEERALIEVAAKELANGKNK